MQIVEIPGIGEVEFPDEMGDAEIVAAVKKLSGPQMMASHAPSDAPAPTPRDLVGVPESGIRGALQGATMGWGDEAAAAIDAALPSWLRNETSARAVAPGLSDVVRGTTGDDWRSRYERARDFYRNRNAEAQQDNPGTYLGGQVAGALASTRGVPLRGVSGVVNAAGLGAAQGAGYSEADEGLGLARDTALGGALGLAGHGAGALVGKAAQGIKGAAGRLLGSAHRRALGQATKEVDEAVASARGQLGAEMQKGSRYVENLLRFEQAGTLAPAQAAELAALRANGTLPALAQSVAQGTLDALPGQAGTIAAKRAALDAATQAAPQTVAQRAGELLKPSPKADTKTFLKAYAEPLVWALAGQQIGELAGLDPGQQAALAAAAGVVGGRTRAGKALRTRLTKPGNQAAIARGLERTGKRIAALRRPVAVGTPALLVPAAIDEE